MEHLLQTGDEVICRINGKKTRGFLSCEGESIFFENSQTQRTEISVEDICFVYVEEEWKEFLFYETTDEGLMALLEEY